MGLNGSIIELFTRLVNREINWIVIENCEFGIEHSESETPGRQPSDLQNGHCVYGFKAGRKDLG